jgi:hypothetical protein
MADIVVISTDSLHRSSTASQPEVIRNIRRKGQVYVLTRYRRPIAIMRPYVGPERLAHELTLTEFQAQHADVFSRIRMDGWSYLLTRYQEPVAVLVPYDQDLLDELAKD